MPSLHVYVYIIFSATSLCCTHQSRRHCSATCAPAKRLHCCGMQRRMTHVTCFLHAAQPFVVLSLLLSWCDYPTASTAVQRTRTSVRYRSVPLSAIAAKAAENATGQPFVILRDYSTRTYKCMYVKDVHIRMQAKIFLNCKRNSKAGDIVGIVVVCGDCCSAHGACCCFSPFFFHMLFYHICSWISKMWRADLFLRLFESDRVDTQEGIRFWRYQQDITLRSTIKKLTLRMFSSINFVLFILLTKPYT